MNPNDVDRFAKALGASGSRRATLRVLTGAALATPFVGLGVRTADAKKKGKKKKRRRAKPRPETCAGDRPFVCGDGCCGGGFSQCCDDALDTSGKICAPASATCCPLSQGGGWCGAGYACCPISTENPTGYCCPIGTTCCQSGCC
jgi:hypothetical protein